MASPASSPLFINGGGNVNNNNKKRRHYQSKITNSNSGGGSGGGINNINKQIQQWKKQRMDPQHISKFINNNTSYNHKNHLDYNLSTILSYQTTKSGDIIMHVTREVTVMQILIYLKKTVTVDQFDNLDNYNFYLEEGLKKLSLEATVIEQNQLTVNGDELIQLKLKINHTALQIIISILSQLFNGISLKQNTEWDEQQNDNHQILNGRQTLPQNSCQKYFTISGNIIAIRGLEITETPFQLLKFLKKNALIEAEYMQEYFDFYLNGLKLQKNVPILEQASVTSEAFQPNQLLEIQLVVASFLKQIKIVDIFKVGKDDDDNDNETDADMNSKEALKPSPPKEEEELEQEELEQEEREEKEEQEELEEQEEEEQQEEQEQEVDSSQLAHQVEEVLKQSKKRNSGFNARRLLPTLFRNNHRDDQTLSSSTSCDGALLQWPFKGQPHNSNGYQIQLWEFLLELLTNPNCAEYIQWTSENEFRMLNPKGVAQLWGERKNNKTMDYEKMSRVLRYYYKEGILEKVGGQNFSYKFVVDLKEITGYDSVELNDMVQQKLEERRSAVDMTN